MNPMVQHSIPTKDFPDWLSPMVVKELRQGLRSKAFQVLFVLLQVALVVGMAIAFSVGGSQSRGIAAGALWTLLSIPLLGIIPLMGFNSVSQDKKNDTLDLVLLTRLQARGIILGKWSALMAQALLLTSAVLPFFVARYYLGGVDLAWELLLLLGILLISACLTLAAVAVSGFFSAIGRILGALGAFFMIQGIGSIFAVSRFSGTLFGTGMGWQNWIFLIWMVLLALLILLELGASKIAPEGENHLSLIRIYSLALFPPFLLCHFGLSLELVVGVCTAFAVVIIQILLLETPPRSPGVFIPFVRRGRLGKAAAWLLGPGRTASTLFSVLLGLVFVVLLLRVAPSINLKAMLLLICAWSAVFTVPAFVSLMTRNSLHRIGFYVVLLGVQFITAGMISSGGSSGRDLRMLAALPMPITQFLLTATSVLKERHYPLQLVGAVVTLSLGAILLGVGAVRAIRPTRLLLQRAEEELQKFPP